LATGYGSLFWTKYPFVTEAYFATYYGWWAPAGFKKKNASTFTITGHRTTEP
jgi:hypothetical protein